MKKEVSKHHRRLVRKLRLKSRKRIKKDKWYIVDIFRKNILGTYSIIRKDFDSKKAAQRAIDNGYSHLNLYLDIIRGDKALEYDFTIGFCNKLRILVSKYDYPPESETLQQKKSFRTKYRRWKRDYKRELKKEYATTTKII